MNIWVSLQMKNHGFQDNLIYHGGSFEQKDKTVTSLKKLATKYSGAKLLEYFVANFV